MTRTLASPPDAGIKPLRPSFVRHNITEGEIVPASKTGLLLGEMSAVAGPRW